MRKHSVRCEMQVLELTKAGSSMRFEIFASAEKIGTIVIGRGSFTWYGKGRHKPKKLSWSRFAAHMNAYAYRRDQKPLKYHVDCEHCGSSQNVQQGETKLKCEKCGRIIEIEWG